MCLFFVVVVQGGEGSKGACDQDREQCIQGVISGKSGENFSEFSMFGPFQYHFHISWRNIQNTIFKKQKEKDNWSFKAFLEIKIILDSCEPAI